jgi:pheromone shutdown protein TraB
MKILLMAAVAHGSSLRVTDAASKRAVVLCGTMHYNPASVDLAASTVRRVGEREKLHSVAIELCASRWNSSIAAQWSREPSWKRTLSEDEFQVAFETARDLGLSDVVLADQEIRETGKRLGAALLMTARDCLSLNGWRQIAADLARAATQAPTFLNGATDIALIRGAPMAFARYLYQSPAALPFIAISVAALTAAAAIDEASGALPAFEDGLITGLLGILLGRAVYLSLIEERNVVLAKNIRTACLTESQSDDDAAVVVAILGMAHLEGVRTALLSEKI